MSQKLCQVEVVQVSQKLGRSLRSCAPQPEVVHEGWSDFLGEPGGVGGWGGRTQ